MEELLNEIRVELPNVSTECLISTYIDRIKEYMNVDLKPNVIFAYIQLLTEIEGELERRGFSSVVNNIKQERNIKI